MKKIPKKTKSKVLFYYDVGIPIQAISITLKISETSVKTILKENNRHSPSPTLEQAFNTWFYLNQSVGEPTIQHLSTDDLQLKKLQQENSELKEQKNQLTEALQKANKRMEKLEQENKDKEEWKQKVTKLTSEIETEKQAKEKIHNKLNEQQEKTLKICLDYQSEIKKLKDKDTARQLDLQENRNTLQRLNDGVKAMTAKIADQEIIIKTRTDERNKFKDNLESLKQKHESDWILTLIIVLISFFVGIIADRTILPKIKEFILSWGAKYGINTEDIANQFSQINMIQPDTQHNYSGAIPIIIVSSTFWSGVFFNPSGKTYSARCEPVQKFDSGVCAPTHGYTSPGYPVVPNPQDDMIQADGQGSGDVTISTFTSDTIQTSGTVMINHVETINIPQVASSHYIPPLQISQMYFLPQTTPVPPELIGPFGWIPIRQMNWLQSTPFICWLFEQLGYKLLSMKKSHDKGADILLERLGERLVIQVKHQQVNTGIDALKDVEFGKTMTNATRKIVISFGSPFTRDAPKDAEKAGIELWDLDCVIDEMHKYNIYYPID